MAQLSIHRPSPLNLSDLTRTSSCLVSPVLFFSELAVDRGDDPPPPPPPPPPPLLPPRLSLNKGIGMALRAARRLASCSRQGRLLLPSQAQAPCNPTAAFLHSHATSFGYKQVREEEKSRLVGNVFSSVASSYDLMNDLMSVGLHRLWKDRLISKLNPFPGMKHLDVAGGTGDVAFRVLERVKSVSHRAMQGTLTDTEEDTHIYVCDINPNMLNVGKKRAAERGYNEEHCLSWIQGDAEALSFEDGSMDGYTIAFGIRNVTHIEKALSEAYRVLKRGGRFLCLELSHVDVPVFKEIYDVYSFSVIPTMGELVSGDRQSYQYLVESIRRFPNQEKFAQMIQEAGFERVEYENLVGGVVAIHSGLKL
ncbi:2-methoxy-6-polyprenyl-1,4-benzoquinol methylase, mitochondrial [Dichanthelium oligosanthes]|uniref:2-methoxy-6-polyprenyl-1,4-benzoquinol methylase, mitochondrial n=1 Tax=Dichanthelium oligosanthes TaxID=888268 RepID=A0A1E5W8X0_9POAL|nr:2-methoxy-6-polyprenyl-1,4-benzoquinol methylase, mitochondrial [Dichanthelium oligosanthes]